MRCVLPGNEWWSCTQVRGNGRPPVVGAFKAYSIDGFLNQSEGIPSDGKPPIMLSSGRRPLRAPGQRQCAEHQCDQEKLSYFAQITSPTNWLAQAGESRPHKLKQERYVALSTSTLVVGRRSHAI
jgi:hypothetical protein